MIVLATCKNEEDPIQNKGARVAIGLYVDFSDIQGQIIPYSVVGYFRNSNSFKHLSMSLIPARMKKVESKMKALEWPQHFPPYKSMGILPDAQGQLSP